MADLGGLVTTVAKFGTFMSRWVSLASGFAASMKEIHDHLEAAHKAEEAGDGVGVRVPVAKGTGFADTLEFLEELSEQDKYPVLQGSARAALDAFGSLHELHEEVTGAMRTIGNGRLLERFTKTK